MSLGSGARLGPYEIVSAIGAGGMGEVYRARDTRLKRDVAIKILPESFSSDPDRLARFQREAEVLASLNHPQIAQIYGLEKSDGTTALVMELVDGEDLSQRIARGPIPTDEALPIAKQIAEALEAAHEQGIIHRDLKPANIKVTPNGDVKVLDFGLAKLNEPVAGGPQSVANLSLSPTITSPALMTGVGVLLGTAAYMAPEQARGKAVDKRADVWAFGVVLFEMLTGRPAFEGDDVPETLGAVLKSEPDWTRLPSELPPSIAKLLRLCLQKDVKKRRQSAGDVRIDLEDALAGPVAGTPIRSARLPWIVAAAAVLVALAFAMFTVRYLREAPSPSSSEMRLQINTPLTSSPLQFSLSPDGLKLAFVASGDGAERLWLRALDKTDAQPMAGTEGAQYPFWSPDSRSIGFFASGKLYRIDSAGGPPRELASAPAGRGGTWNRDGVIVFAPTIPSPLMRVGASGGEPVPVTKLDPPRSTYHKLPQFLPDGHHFLFYAQGSAGGIYLGTLDGGDPRHLASNDSAGTFLAPDRLAYVRQELLVAQRLDVERGELTGDPETVTDSVHAEPVLQLPGFSISTDGLVAYRAGGGGRNQLSWYDRAGKTMAVTGEPDVSLQYAELSPDGQRVAVDRLVQSNRDVWLMDLERGGMTRLTFDAADDGFPLWSPDGMRIVFRSTRKGTGDLYVKLSNGAGTEELLIQTPNDKTPLDWSRDGGFLLYSEQDPKMGFDLNALPMTGNERKPVVVMNTRFDERNGQFSPDGRWVAYATNESGRYEIVVQPFPAPTGKWQVSMGGGLQPRWRSDGRELYFIAPDGKLMAASVNPSAATFAAAAPVALFQTRILGGGTNLPSKPYYAVSSDDRFLILHSTDEATVAPITLLLNWKPKP